MRVVLDTGIFFSALTYPYRVLKRYIQVLSGELEVRTKFPDGEVTQFVRRKTLDEIRV